MPRSIIADSFNLSCALHGRPADQAKQVIAGDGERYLLIGILNLRHIDRDDVCCDRKAIEKLKGLLEFCL